MTTKARLGNNVIAALEAILAIHHDVWPEVRALNEYARNRMDVTLLARLNVVTIGLAEIKAIAANARAGHYEEPR
jgi:hypothetical protein